MRILLVAYYFPPYNSVGAIRPNKLASWLHHNGHDVHVLTCSNQPFPEGLEREIPLQQVTAVPSWSINAPIEFLLGGRKKVAHQGFGATTASKSYIGKLGHLYKLILHWPDGQIGWVGAAIRAGNDLISLKQFDLIYVSAPPFSALRVASTLSRKSGIPWVAEFRDLWTENHAYDAPFWKRWLEKIWESRLLSSATALVTVSAPLVNKLKIFGRPVLEVRNGFDPENFRGLKKPDELTDDPDILNIIFTGNVYDEYYDVDAFCGGLAIYIKYGGGVRVHVAGRNTFALQEAARRHGLLSNFEFQSTTPHRHALSMQKYADLLLTFLWGQAEMPQGLYSAKLFEYIGAGRPILGVGVKSDVADIIVNNGLGYVSNNPGEISDILQQVHSRKKNGGYERSFAINPNKYSRAAQFSILMTHLQHLIHRS